MGRPRLLRNALQQRRRSTVIVHSSMPLIANPWFSTALPRARQQTRAYGSLLHPTDNKYVVLGHPMNQIKPKTAHLRASILVHAPFRPKTTHLLAHAGLTPGRPPLAPSTRFPAPVSASFQPRHILEISSWNPICIKQPTKISLISCLSACEAHNLNTKRR